MSDLHSRVSTKGRTVIPEVARQRLGLKTGDPIRFKFDHTGVVTIERVVDDDLFVSFSEWTSDEDERLCHSL